MTTFRKKPVEVEAVQYDGTNADEVRRWQYVHVKQVGHPSVWFAKAEESYDWMNPEGADAVVYDYLHSTWVGVTAGQWIIRGIKGEFYPCADDVFVQTYEPVD